MYGYNYTYQELLEKSGLETLKSRRDSAMLKFAQKTSKNPVYKHMFPLNPSAVRTRDHKHYKEDNAKTDRLYKSPLFAMRRLLNNTPDSDRNNNPNYVDLSHLFNDPYLWNPDSLAVTCPWTETNQ